MTETTQTTPATQTAKIAKRTGWKEVDEVGAGWGIALLVRLATAFGRAPARLVVRVVAFYYALLSTRARAAANDFLARVGAPTGFWAAHRQILRFAEVALDALFFLRGKLEHFEVTRDGKEHLTALKNTGTGAVLLGAHMGSFYVMRAAGQDEALPLYPLVFTKNARKINDALRTLDPEGQTQLIEMDDKDIGFMLKVRELVEAGGLIAILADRLADGAKHVTVDFLGGKARLPVGPYILAASLRCPVYFVAGIYRAPKRYELRCEPFAERIELPRKSRQEALAMYAQKYADIVARYARDAPDNWFNFYDFWVSEQEGRVERAD
jgi:predicted LPLAT superfamily acyltransferase